jgi:S1-C subfamily serine protease
MQHGLGEDEYYARAAQAAYRSVVNIDTTERVRVRSLFGDFMDVPRYSEQQSHGSGVIIDPGGYVLTNEHVVGAAHENGRQIMITLTDGRKFRGTVVGADHQTDVALVHVDASGLPAAKMGTVRGLIPGQMVVALGNPLDFRFTVTHGVVSALGRPINAEGRVYADLIQHDALINPGNSGGALVNLQGQVIGINTLVASQAQGIGFAIPIDTALKVADELKRYGKIKRPTFGLAPVTNTPAIAEGNDLPNIRGVVVGGLYPGGPAARAGLQVGDIITRIDGREVASEDDFKAAEKASTIGHSVHIKIVRGDQSGDTTLTVGEAP